MPLQQKFEEPGIFSHVRSGKGRKEVERTCVWAYLRLRTGKRAKVAGNLLTRIYVAIGH